MPPHQILPQNQNVTANTRIFTKHIVKSDVKTHDFPHPCFNLTHFNPCFRAPPTFPPFHSGAARDSACPACVRGQPARPAQVDGKASCRWSTWSRGPRPTPTP